MTVEQLAKELDILIPDSLSEPWDNDGRMVIPTPNAEVTRVLCALDCTGKAIQAAKAWACNVIVTHHPLVFKPIGSVTPDDSVGKRIIECIKNGIAVLSYHTRLDSMDGGVNDKLAELIGLKNVQAFIPYGRIGDAEDEAFPSASLTFLSFADRVAEALEIEPSQITVVRANDTTKRVALVSGCGKDEIKAAIDAGADTFVTGEVMHNHLIDCMESGLNLICGTHFATERIILPVLAEKVRSCGVPADVWMFRPEIEFGLPLEKAHLDELEEN